jgi:hypothetical protein
MKVEKNEKVTILYDLSKFIKLSGLMYKNINKDYFCVTPTKS